MSQVWLLVRARAWVAGSVFGWGKYRKTTDQYFCLTWMFLSLLSLPPPKEIMSSVRKKNKQISIWQWLVDRGHLDDKGNVGGNFTVKGLSSVVLRQWMHTCTFIHLLKPIELYFTVWVVSVKLNQNIVEFKDGMQTVTN